MDALGIRRLPHPFLMDKYVRKTLHLDIPLVGGALATVGTGRWEFVTFGAIATVWFAAVAVLVLVPGARNALVLPTPDDAIGELNWQLAQYRPQVALYFTFAAVSRDFMYQVNMWLEALESLELRPIIVLRERATLRFLDATSVPVVCVPKAEYLARVEMPELRVTLYPGNAGKNVHMLQRHEVKHVFIGHGDSDKLASSNRVSKVFDEIWVAGRAGRDRYERIKHAVTAHQIVEVGRPQLMPLERWSGSVSQDVPTVIYAPTWEGWTDDACYTSVIPSGERLIRTLLADERKLRIIYKPHPLTGTRSPPPQPPTGASSRFCRRTTPPASAARSSTRRPPHGSWPGSTRSWPPSRNVVSVRGTRTSPRKTGPSGSASSATRPARCTGTPCRSTPTRWSPSGCRRCTTASTTRTC